MKRKLGACAVSRHGFRDSHRGVIMSPSVQFEQITANGALWRVKFERRPINGPRMS